MKATYSYEPDGLPKDADASEFEESIIEFARVREVLLERLEHVPDVID